MDDSMSKLRETFQTWLQQRQEQVVNLDTYTPEPSQYRKIPICYDDDDDEYSFATQEILLHNHTQFTKILPKSNSPIMDDEHLDTILETVIRKLIKSSVEDCSIPHVESQMVYTRWNVDLPFIYDSSPKKDEVLIIISIPPGNGNDHFNAESSPIESVLNRDNVISSPKIDLLIEEFTDIRFIENLMYDNSFPRPPETLKDESETVIDSNNDYSSSDNDSYEDIDYVDASPPDSELVSLEVIEALKYNPTPSSDFVTKSSSTSPNFFLEETNTFDNSLPESKTFCFNPEEKNSGSTTILSDYSLLDYEAFYLDDDHIEEKSSGSTTTHADFSQYDLFIFDILINPFPPADRSDFYHEEFAGELAHIISPSKEPRVHVPNVLPTHPTFHLDSDFTLSSDSLGSDLVFSFPSGTRNKIFDPGIFIGVQSIRFLSLDEFSISFIRDLPFPVIDTFLPFSPQNEDKVVNPGILTSNEEKSPHLLSHRGFNPSKTIFDFSKSPMMIYGGDIPILDVPFLHFYPP
ncbi:hypothetical protein Tco_0221206 [Tanacetum coccineum]